MINFLNENKEHKKNDHSPELDEDYDPRTSIHTKINNISIAQQRMNVTADMPYKNMHQIITEIPPR